MQLHQAIFKIEKVLSKDWCKNLTQYMDIVCNNKATVLINNKRVEDTKQRNVYDYGLSDQGQDVDYNKILSDVIKDNIRQYLKSFTYLLELKMEGINLLKYTEGNFYNTHIDSFHTVNRQISIIINLNENYEGGDIVFMHPTTRKPYSKIRLKTGEMLLFPSNFMYPHQVTKITKGIRYSCVSGCY